MPAGKNNANNSQDEAIERCLRSFSQHLMSNAKWVRLIQHITSHMHLFDKILFKRVQDDKEGELYLQEDTSYKLDYWDIGFEGNHSLGGWLTFKEIEYLLFPPVNDNEQPQDYLSQIETSISGIGEFRFERAAEGLKLICYCRY
jgi:hypothetical protein